MQFLFTLTFVWFLIILQIICFKKADVVLKFVLSHEVSFLRFYHYFTIASTLKINVRCIVKLTIDKGNELNKQLYMNKRNSYATVMQSLRRCSFLVSSTVRHFSLYIYEGTVVNGVKRKIVSIRCEVEKKKQ